MDLYFTNIFNATKFKDRTKKWDITSMYNVNRNILFASYLHVELPINSVLNLKVIKMRRNYFLLSFVWPLLHVVKKKSESYYYNLPNCPITDILFFVPNSVSAAITKLYILTFFCLLCYTEKSFVNSSGSGGAEGAMAPPDPVKIGHKKMAAKGGHIDFMFLGPLPLTRPLDPLLVNNMRFFFLYLKTI